MNHFKPLGHRCSKLTDTRVKKHFDFLMRDGSENLLLMEMRKKEKEESTVKEIILYFETCFFANQIITGISQIIQLNYSWCECLNCSP